MIYISHLQALHDPSSHGLSNGYVMWSLQNHCLKYDEMLGVSHPLINSPQFIGKIPHKYIYRFNSWGIIETQWYCWEVLPTGLKDGVVCYSPTEVTIIICVKPVSIDVLEDEALWCWFVPRDITFCGLLVHPLSKCFIWVLCVCTIVKAIRIVVPVVVSLVPTPIWTFAPRFSTPPPCDTFMSRRE